jgi:hypothetical protein
MDVNRAVGADVHAGLSNDDLDVLDRLLFSLQENLGVVADGATGTDGR